MSPSSGWVDSGVVSRILYTQSRYTPDLWLVANGADPIPRSRRLGAHGKVNVPAETAGSAVVRHDSLDSSSGTFESRLFERRAHERDQFAAVLSQFQTGPDEDKAGSSLKRRHPYNTV